MRSKINGEKEKFLEYLEEYVVEFSAQSEHFSSFGVKGISEKLCGWPNYLERVRRVSLWPVTGRVEVQVKVRRLQVVGLLLLPVAVPVLQ